MTTELKKAVFPVAGLGTRFLPATKANPKEMLPIVDKPLIQYAVEEAIAAGFTEMIFVTSSSKRAIEDHFDTNHELEARLLAQDKQELLAITKSVLPEGIHCTYVRQPEPLGLGDAVLRTKAVVGDEHFAVLLADDLIECEGKNCLQQMVDYFQQVQTCIIAVEKIASEQTNKYGVIAIKESLNNYHQMADIIEKPRAEDAPSNLGVAGRYLLTPSIFNYLEKTKQGTGNEIQLTDAISQLLKDEAIYGLEFTGKRYDCGNKLGYLKATIVQALKHPELGEKFRGYLQSLGD